MKVGDYVRFNGEIAKIIDITRYKTKENIYVFDRILDLNEDSSCNDNTIYNSQWKYFDNVKSSPNIIDLIEVGDYVNGCLIVEITKDPFIKEQINLWTNMILSEGEPFPNEYFKEKIIEKDIKSIVTKEQFESMEYKIGE